MHFWPALTGIWLAASLVLGAPIPESITDQANGVTISEYQLPSIYPASSMFSLRVNGQNVPVTSNTDYEYARFSMSKPAPNQYVPIVIQTLSGANPTHAAVSPLKNGIEASVAGKEVAFSVRGRYYLIVKISDRKELVIMMDMPENEKIPASKGNGVWNVASPQYKGTDLTGSTKGFQKALDDAANGWKTGQPQSVVYVPAGVYNIGNIVLKSNTWLYLEPGAALRWYGKDAKKHYYKASQGRWVSWWISTAFGSENISVTGKGTLDANGVQSIEEWKMGNNVLVPIQTTSFKFDGPILRNSAAWSFTPIRSENVDITQVKILNRLWQNGMGENDGIDVMHSKSVHVHRGIGIALDDPWSTKTWAPKTDIMLNWPPGPAGILENVVFEDLISWTACFGFKVGAGIYETQNNIVFKQGVVYDSSVGIGIDHDHGTAATSNVQFLDIDIENVSYSNQNRSSWQIFELHSNANRAVAASSQQAVDTVTVSNIRVRDTGKAYSTLAGLDNNHRIKGVSYSNMVMPILSKPHQKDSSKVATTLDELFIPKAKRYQFENVKIDGIPVH